MGKNEGRGIQTECNKIQIDCQEECSQQTNGWKVGVGEYSGNGLVVRLIAGSKQVVR